MSSSSGQLRALLVGFGNVGRQLARIVTLEREQFPNLRDLDLSVVAVLTASRGALVNPAGVDLTRALYEVESEGRFSNLNPEFQQLRSMEAVEALDYDVLVELSTLNIEENGEPALSYIEKALARGKHSVTANKGPIAFAYSDLVVLAEAENCALLFESTVMDGAPIFSMGREGLKGSEILELEGVLNSTTNFVLTRMELGDSAGQAVRLAQELGFAEADPNHDLEGWDAAVKICILANVLMGANLTPFDVEREGITTLTQQDLGAALGRGQHLKLVCRAWREFSRVRAEVKVRPVAHESLFGLTSGSASALRISTDLMGPIAICQEEPTPYDTAYGVLSDLMIINSLGL
jgi:homoserine dehydrogenase